MAVAEKKAYFMFGRFNPVTVGHGSIFRQLAEDARQDGADAYVFVSSTQNSNKNPLSIEQKMEYINKLYGDLGIHFINTTSCHLGNKVGPCKSVPSVLERLREMRYTNLFMYVGSDRVEDFQWIPKSNIKKREQGANINPVVLVNKMPPRSNNNFIASMSASKIRAAALTMSRPGSEEDESSIQFIRRGTGLSRNNTIQLRQDIRNAIFSSPINQPTQKRSKKKGGTYRKYTAKKSKK